MFWLGRKQTVVYKQISELLSLWAQGLAAGPGLGRHLLCSPADLGVHTRLQAWLKAPFTQTGTVCRWDALVCGLNLALSSGSVSQSLDLLISPLIVDFREPRAQHELSPNEDIPRSKSLLWGVGVRPGTLLSSQVSL